MAEKKSLIKGMYNWTFLVIVIVAIVLLNIISSFLSKRWDVTEDQRYSLTEGTIDYLTNEKSFKNRILIRIYFDGNLPSELKHFRNSIEDKLNIINNNFTLQSRFKNIEGELIVAGYKK